MKNLILVLSVIAFSNFIHLSAQDEEEIRINFFDAEFFLAEEDYRDALLAYQNVYNAGYEDNANIDRKSTRLNSSHYS